MNPQELLRKIALYVSNGMPPEEADRFVAQESGHQYTSVQELSDALGRQRQAQSLKDNPPSTAEKVQQFAGGLGQNALQGLLLNHADEMAGGLAAATGGNYRQGQLASQAIGDQFAQQHPYLAATAQTAGGLAGMIGTGLVGQPEASVAYVPGLLKAIAAGGAWGGVAGAGAAPTVKDIPQYANRGALAGEATGGLLGVTVPAASWLYNKGSDVLSMLRGDPAMMRKLADRQVGYAVASDQADGGGLPMLDQMQAQELRGVVPADAGSTSSAMLRQSANREPSVRLPVKQLVRDRQAQVGPNMARALERTRGMTQTEARAGADEALAAKQALGPQFDAVDATPLPADSPAAQLIEQFRSWAKPEAQMSPQELMVRRQNFKMGMGPNPDIPPPPRPYGAPKVARITERALRNTGDRPLTVGHARAILNNLKDAFSVALKGTARDRSLVPALREQIGNLEGAIEQSSPDFLALNQAYKAQRIAEDAFKMGRGTRLAEDPIQAMADRNAAIRAGAPETRTRMAQGSTADWTDMLRSSDQRAPGADFNELANVASPRRDLTGEADPRRALWKSDFTSQQNVNQMDQAVALQDRMRQTEGDILGNSTTAAQGNDLGAGTSYQVLRDMVRGGTLKWGVARSFADLLDAIKRPQTRAMARMVAEDMMAPYTPQVRQRLWGLMQIADQEAQTRGAILATQLQRAGATGGLLSAGGLGR